MKDENPIVSFFGGIMVGAGALALIMSTWPTAFNIYHDGVRATQKEAFDNGLMVKEIGKDDAVIYHWLELHKQPEE
jgi:hypothetical protein